MQVTPVTLKLTEDEALVLFEWLVRVADDESLAKTFVHEAEQRVLWDLEAMLEQMLVAVVSPSYKELLQQARERVANPQQ